jgi:hypothetical protein
MANLSIEEMLQGIGAQQDQTAQSILSIEEMLQGLDGSSTPAAEPEEQSLMDWFKGGKREETIPLIQGANLGLPEDKARQMTALLATTASDDRLQSGIQKILPNAQFDKDRFGNLVVIAPVYRDGQETQQYTRFYPNPKGLNAVDLMQGAGAVALGQAIAATGGLAGLPTAGMLGGGLIGMTEAAIVEAASSKLSDDPFQVFDIPIGFFGGALGAKAAQVLGDIVAKVKTRPSTVLDSNGNLKASVRAQLTQLGLDPDNITAELAAKIKGEVRRVGKPEASAALAEAESLPTPVPLTRGEASGSRAQQLFEDQAESGAFGEGTRLFMERQRGLQQEALSENLSQIQRGLGGQEITTGQGGKAAQEALATQRAAEKAAATELFNIAKRSGHAFISPNMAGAVADDLRSVMDDYSLMEIPVVDKIVIDMEEVLATGGDITRLFQLRRQLVNAGDAGSVTQKAAGEVRQQLDASLKALVDQQLLLGADEAVTAQLAAIRNYADFAKKWKSDGILNRLTKQVTRDGELVFKEPPENVANYLFGAAGSKLSKGTQMVRDLRTMKANLPEEQWNELRQEAFIHMANKARKMGDDGQPVISGSQFQNFWNEMKKNNPDLVSGLFSPEEQRLISRFASVARRATAGAKNYSNTMTTANSLLGLLAEKFGQTSIVRLGMRAPFIKMFSGAVAEKSFDVPLGRATQPISGAAGAAAASGQGGDPFYDMYRGVTGINIPR